MNYAYFTEALDFFSQLLLCSHHHAGLLCFTLVIIAVLDLVFDVNFVSFSLNLKCTGYFHMNKTLKLLLDALEPSNSEASPCIDSAYL